MDSIDKISPEITSGQILQAFYKENDLPEDGGFAEPRAKVKITKQFHLYIPNIDARRKALLKHDIHHLLTGYSTLLTGELEASAWEIGSGCSKYWFAWAINMQGFMLGFLDSFRRGIPCICKGKTLHKPLQQ